MEIRVTGFATVYDKGGVPTLYHSVYPRSPNQGWPWLEDGISVENAQSLADVLNTVAKGRVCQGGGTGESCPLFGVVCQGYNLIPNTTTDLGPKMMDRFVLHDEVGLVFTDRQTPQLDEIRAQAPCLPSSEVGRVTPEFAIQYRLESTTIFSQ